jgi:hypothetical protein
VRPLLSDNTLDGTQRLRPKGIFSVKPVIGRIKQ